MRNLITDIPGVLVGNVTDASAATGVSVVVFAQPAVASVDVRGGAPGTRETDLLQPERTVERIDAIALSGGSAFGLDAAAGVMAALHEQGRGFAVGATRVPIVPAAILFDLSNDGDKAWGRFPPYRDLGYEATRQAGAAFDLGSVGAGTGAIAGGLKGGLGSASARIDGVSVGALVAVNSCGSVTIGDGPHFWAAPYEQAGEFGGVGWPSPWPANALDISMKRPMGANTTIAVVATDAALTKGEARHLAIMAQDGLARSIRPVHTPLDGDTVFAAAVGRVRATDLSRLGSIAADVLARAVARAVFTATRPPRFAAVPTWREKFLA